MNGWHSRIPVLATAALVIVLGSARLSAQDPPPPQACLEAWAKLQASAWEICDNNIEYIHMVCTQEGVVKKTLWRQESWE